MLNIRCATLVQKEAYAARSTTSYRPSKHVYRPRLSPNTDRVSDIVKLGQWAKSAKVKVKVCLEDWSV